MVIGDERFDAYLRGIGDLVTGVPLLPAWSPDGATVGFVTGPVDDRRAWSVDLATGEKSPLLDVQRTRDAISAATGETPPGRGIPFAAFGFAGPHLIAFQVGAQALTLDLSTYTVTKPPAEGPMDGVFDLGRRARSTPKQFLRTQPLIDPMPAFEVLSPDAKFFLSTERSNIVLRSTSDSRTVNLTLDGTPEVEYRFDLTNPQLAILGMAAPATNWSPDATRVAIYRVDNRGVALCPQVHYLKREDEVVFRYHTKAGGTLERYTLHVVDVYGKGMVDIDLGDTRDTYPVFAGWLPDSRRLLLFLLSRDCRRAQVSLADAVTGEVTPLFNEQGDTFIRIHHDVYFGRKLGCELTPDGTQVLWLSERSGWKHIFLYDLQGNLVRQLTDGEWPVDHVDSVRDGFVYFTAHIDQRRPYDTHLVRVPLAGGEVEQLTREPGVHSVVFAPTGAAFLDTFSTPAEPPVTVLRSAAGRLLGEVARADVTALETLGWSAPEQFTVKAADGTTDLWGVLFKPHDFDASKRYPVIEYIYGGPQIAVAPHSFVTVMAPMGAMAQALAQLGYVTVVLDARGTPERSKAFHDAIYRRWANVLADDHAEALKQLAARHSFIDLDRVGITGGSWGGYSSFRCLADRPDVYKAAVISAPGFDPYSSVLYECYLDLPQDNVDGYRFADLYHLAPTLQGSLMIAGGTSDHATWTDAIKMSEALINAGKLHEFVALPEQYHGYASVHDAYFWRKTVGHFRAALGEPLVVPGPDVTASRGDENGSALSVEEAVPV